jgi:hypothetical protein
MRLSIAIGVCIALAVGIARADDAEQADALFKDGRAAMAAGKISEACEKFEASLRLNSSAVGTLLNAANCDQKRGRVASAVNRFKRALDIAHEEENTRAVEEAQKQLAVLGPLVPHISITISQRLPGMKLVIDDKAIQLDDKAIPVDGVGVREMPIDPGDHEINVSAPGRLPFDYKFSIIQSESKTIAIPVLVAPGRNTRKTLGLIVGGSGLAVAAAGGIVGLIAKRDYDAQFSGTMPACNRMTHECNHDGLLATENARSLGTIATGIMIVGAAAIVTGGVLWFTAPKQPTETKLAITPQIGSGEIGFAAVGRF